MRPLIRRLAAAALVAAPFSVLHAQVRPILTRADFFHLADESDAVVGSNDLNALPDGSTVIEFAFSCSRPHGCWQGVLTGASVTGGQITSSGPFSIRLGSGGTAGFGADFASATNDEVVLQFFNGNGLVGTASRPIGPEPQFAGGISVFGPVDHVDISVRQGSTFTADNLLVADPEPATVLLVATGLVGAAVLARRRARG